MTNSPPTPSRESTNPGEPPFASPSMLASYCINKGYREQKDAWMVAWELMKEMATLTPSESERCRHGVCKTDHCWKCDEAKRESIGFNEFLGQVQHRLIQDGYNPPIWPMPPIRDQGDLDSALDSCVQWCKDRLTPSATGTNSVVPGLAVAEELRACSRYHINSDYILVPLNVRDRAVNDLENFHGICAAWKRDYDGEKQRGDAWMADCKAVEAKLASLQSPHSRECEREHASPDGDVERSG
jgi:hypothetical protein